MLLIQHPFPVTAVQLVLRIFLFELVFEAGLSSEEQGGHLGIDMREKANVRYGLQHLATADRKEGKNRF